MNRQNLLQNKYSVARYNLLLALLCGLVNVITAVLGSSFYLPFSPIFPLIITWTGYDMAYDPELNSIVFLIVAVIIAVISLLPFLVCWFFSKKHKLFMIIALVLFSLDTVFLLWIALSPFDASFLIDIAFHAWVMYYLILGVRHGDEAGQTAQAEMVDQNGIFQPPVDPANASAQNGMAYAPINNTPANNDPNAQAQAQVQVQANDADKSEPDTDHGVEDWNKPQE